MFDLGKKLFFRKITGQEKGEILDETYQKRVLNDMFYFLCGLNTPTFKHSSSDGSKQGNQLYIKEIRKLAGKTQAFEKFISENEFSEDSIKRIICAELERKVFEFYNFIIQNRNEIESVEDFLIKASQQIELFEEITILLETVKEYTGDIIINILKERKDKMVQFDAFYGTLIEKFSININRRIAEFAFEGETCGSFFMIREKSEIEFKEKLISDKFKIFKSNVPFYIEDSKLILESGIYSYFVSKFKDENFYLDENLNQSKILNDLPVEIFDLSNTRAFNDQIKAHRDIQHQHLCSIFADSLESEWSVIKNFLFILDQSQIYDMLSDLGPELLNTKNIKIAKINRFIGLENIKVSVSKSSLTTVVGKILNLENNLQIDEELSVIEGLMATYTPDQSVKLLFSEKNIHELELIFRMLFTFQAINFCMKNKPRTEFNNILLSINNHLISSFYSQGILQTAAEISTLDFKVFMNKLDDLITKSLRDLYITSYNVFKILSKYFNLCFKHIKYDNGEMNELKQIIIELNNEIDNENHNLFMSYQLFTIKNKF